MNFHFPVVGLSFRAQQSCEKKKVLFRTIINFKTEETNFCSYDLWSPWSDAYVMQPCHTNLVPTLVLHCIASLVPRLESDWCPNLCHLGAQTCVRSVPRLKSDLCPDLCHLGAHALMGVYWSREGCRRYRYPASQALQCRPARQPAFLARGEPGSTVRKDISANTEPESKKSRQRTRVRPKSPGKASLGIMPFINEMNITIQCESHKIHIEYRGRASFNIHYPDRSPKSPVPRDVWMKWTNNTHWFLSLDLIFPSEKNGT